MADDEVTTIDVTVKGAKGGELHTNGAFADFDIDGWHELLEQNKGGQLTVSVYAEKGGQWTAYRDFTIFVSNYPLDEWGITYRRIPPSYQIYSKMGLYQRCLSTFEENAMLVNTQINGMCINCHTPNKTNPDQYVFHARGANGATIIHRNGKDELLQARNEFLGGRWYIPTGIPKDATVPSQPMPPVRCSISQTRNVLRSMTLNQTCLSMTLRHIPSSRTR